MTTYYTSNDASIGFDATTSGTLPGDWAAKVGTWHVGTTNPVGAHAQSFGSTTDADGDVALLTGISATADMQIRYTQVLPSGVPGETPIIVPVLRSDSGYANCYTIVIGVPGAGVLNLSLFKRVSGSYSQVGTAENSPQSFSTSGAIILNVCAQCSGTSISIKVWQKGTTEPGSWDFTWTDGSVSAAGYPGLYNALNSASASARGIDDFLASDTGGAAETITVTTPGSETAGGSYSYSGTYTGTQPAALGYEFDSAGYAAASSPTISGGTWSFTATAPAAGSHTLSVRDHSITVVAGTSGSFSTGAGESLTVTTPGTETAGNSYTYSGSYTNGPPSGIDYEFDGAGFASSGATIGGGTWSFTATAPAAGSHTLSVRDSGNHAVTATSGSFSTTGTTIAITTPSGLVIDGQSLTVSGSYAGTAPTGLNYKFDGGGYGAASSPTISGGTWSFAVTAPAFGSHTITVQEANATGVTATSGSFVVSSAPNHAAMLYSPYTWNVGGAAAITNNAGAYVRTLFGASTTCVLNFDVSGMVSPTSEIWSRIDNGAWSQAAVATTVTLTIPAVTLSNADVPYHLLEVVVKSTTETQNRWNSGSSTRVVFKGLTLDAGATLLAPLRAPKNLLIYGDSITEGVRTLGESAASDTDRNDAMMGWAFRLGALLGAEVGVVGFGGSGLAVTGSGNVPVLGSSYSLLYSGVSRVFSPAPDMVLFNVGTNDGAANTVAAMTGVLNGVLSACPGAVIAVLRPFNGNQAANLQSAIAACGNPGACHWIDTTGFFNAAYGVDGLGLHPSGPNDVALIAPQLAAALRPLLAPAATALPFRGGFQRGLLG